MAFTPTPPPAGRSLEEMYDWAFRLVNELEIAFETRKVWPGGQVWEVGYGDPEGVLAAPIGSLYTRTDGGTNTTFYVKESGTGNTGWVAK